MPTITSTPFWTLAPLEGVASRLGFSFTEGLVPFGLPLPRKFLLGKLDREPFPFPLDSLLFSGSRFIPHCSSREH